MIDTHSIEFTLTAAATDWKLEMPLSDFVELIINTATAHANRLGIGFGTLSKSGASWVLSRLCITLGEMPQLGLKYRLTTWIQDWSRMFSRRCFRLENAETGATIGWIHSVWMAIDLKTRRTVDLTAVIGQMDGVLRPDIPFEGNSCGRLQPPGHEDYGYDRVIRVADIDINRHLTTKRYIDMLVNLWPLEHYTGHRVSGFEIAFKHEILYGATAHASRCGTASQITADGVTCALASFTFADR